LSDFKPLLEVAWEGRVLKRHADAGYDIAKETVKSYNLDIDKRLK